MAVSNTTYSIRDFQFYPNEALFVLNGAQVSDDDIDVNDPWFFHEGHYVNVIRYSRDHNRLSVEYGEYDTFERAYNPEGTDTVECTDPRTVPNIGDLIVRFESLYLDTVYALIDRNIQQRIEDLNTDIQGFSLSEIKRACLGVTDWMLVADSPLTEQERNQWILWRQRIRDWESTGDPMEDLSLKFPVPPELDRHGVDIRDIIDGYEMFKLNKVKLQAIEQFSFDRTNVTQEEYLANGPLIIEQLNEELFSDDQFFSKYSL